MENNAAWLLAEFIENAMKERPHSRPEIALFEATKDLPYATNEAHNLEELLQTGRGDCLAKSELLYGGFTDDAGPRGDLI